MLWSFLFYAPNLLKLAYSGFCPAETSVLTALETAQASPNEHSMFLTAFKCLSDLMDITDALAEGIVKTEDTKVLS